MKNIWLHDQVVSNHSMLADVMRELSSACVVVSRDLLVIHANKAARKLFGETGARAGELDFSSLPPTLGSKVFQVLKTGSAVSPFRHTPEDVPGAVYQVTIVPITGGDATVPSSALLMVEDRTQIEQLQRLEIETKNLRLIRSMADRLAAEIGNAMKEIFVHPDFTRVGHCRAILEEAGVATTPGDDFDPARGKHYLRMCYAGSAADMQIGRAHV